MFKMFIKMTIFLGLVRSLAEPIHSPPAIVKVEGENQAAIIPLAPGR